ncbi:MAG TPA: hypothetical protein VJX67_02205 [Blastocatellia bacterium]|nr:hypothetical protein [Blastocatellia bacterium]
MMTSLVDLDEAKGRIALGEQAYAYEISDHKSMVGPACGFGPDYLRRLRREGRYAGSLEEATQVAVARGASITGVWFVLGKQPPAAK